MTVQLVDPKDLNSQEKRALSIVRNNSRLMRVRNGYRQISANVTLKMVERLEALGLVRQTVVGARPTVVLTGSGGATLAIMDERAQNRGRPTTETARAGA